MSRAWPVRGIDPDGTLADNARRILAVRVAELYSHAPAVPIKEAVDELHAMRISAKRLRYTLELFRTVFGKRGERQIDRVKELQEGLGIIHDHDVRLLLIETELRALATAQVDEVGRALAAAPPEDHGVIVASALRPPGDDPRRGLLSLLGRQHAARRADYRSFVARWDELNADGLRADLVGLSAAPASPNRSTGEEKPDGKADVDDRPR